MNKLSLAKKHTKKEKSKYQVFFHNASQINDSLALQEVFLNEKLKKPDYFRNQAFICSSQHWAIIEPISFVDE